MMYVCVCVDYVCMGGCMYPEYVCVYGKHGVTEIFLIAIYIPYK
jgi:hypothetical protein